MRDHGLALAALLAGIALSPSPATAATSALGKLKKGDTVEAEGAWDGSKGAFRTTEIEKLKKARRPNARGAIDTLDGSSAKLTIFGREIQVSDRTVFASSTGVNGGRFSDLQPGMRVEVTADVEEPGAWTATKVVWQGVRGSDKVKGTITDIRHVDGSLEAVEISGLLLHVTERTELKTDYLEDELLGGLFSDVGDVNAPHLRLGKRLLLAGDCRLATRHEAGFTLSEEDDERVVTAPALTMQLAGDWGPALQSLIDVGVHGDAQWEGGRSETAGPNLEARQAYAILRTPGGKGAALLVGKQRIRDSREWLFDEQLDAVRLYLYWTRPVVLEASYLPSILPPKGESFETWDDVLLRTRFIPDSRNEASLYFLKRRDSSPRNRQPVYWGLSYHGRTRRVLAAWLEASLLRGEDRGRPQRAWALDGGATLTSRGRVRASVTGAYAVGSGEEKEPGDPFSQEFRQTGYQDNTGRFGGFSSFQYYGEVLDPELSNIRILTLAAGLRFGSSVSLDGVYHTYRQHRLDNDLRAALKPASPPNEDSPDLGRELDVIVAVRNLWKRASMSYSFGRFEPGAALAGSQGHATRHRLSVRVAF
jgi:hypothetical protein